MFGFLAQLLDWCYRLWPSYGGSIVLFTLIVMAAVTPFTVKGMRSAAEMARLQPEMKKLQDQYKNDRVKQNEEMQALFKEHGVNPLGGCLPTLLPLPIFFIIFRLLRALSSRHNGAFSPLVRLVRGQVGGTAGYVTPHYLTFSSALNHAIIHTNGVLKFLGVDLALTARDHHPSVGAALPFYGLIVIMTVSQYWQQRQINQRNPAAANANPQMKLTMQLFPAFYAIISLSIPASVVLYLLLSGLYRMAQNAISYRFDPVMARAAIPPDGTITTTAKTKGSAPQSTPKAALTAGKGAGRGGGSAGTRPGGGKSPAGRTSAKGAAASTSGGGGGSGGFMAQLRAQAAEARAAADAQAQAKAEARSGQKGAKPQVSNGAKPERAADVTPEPARPEPAPEPAPAVQRAAVDEFEPAPVEPGAVERGPVEAAPFAEAPQSLTPPSVAPSEGSSGEGSTSASPLSIRPAGRRRKGDR